MFPEKLAFAVMIVPVIVFAVTPPIAEFSIVPPVIAPLKVTSFKEDVPEEEISPVTSP